MEYVVAFFAIVAKDRIDDSILTIYFVSSRVLGL
jgi:hypothetical protein